jgi:hypothetical protein
MLCSTPAAVIQSFPTGFCTWVHQAMMPLWCSILASLSCVLAALGLWCLYRARKLLEGASVRSLSTLSNEVAELLYQFESLQAQHKRLASRVGMREVRHRKESGDEETDGGGPVGEKLLPRAKLKEVARARGFKVS